MINIIPLAQNYEIPVISYGSETTAEPLPTVPGFYRINQSLKSKTEALASVCEHFGWSQVGLIHSKEAWGLDSLKNIEEYNLKKKDHKLKLVSIVPVGIDLNYTTAKQAVEQLKRENVKIVILQIFKRQLKYIYKALKDAGMVTQGYAYAQCGKMNKMA